jgi:hypothetical protein
MANEYEEPFAEEPFAKLSQWEMVKREMDAMRKARGSDAPVTDTRTSSAARDAPDDDAEYALVYYGFFPDGSPKVSYRRAVKFAEERQKTIKCPYCGKPLTAVDVSTRVEIYRYPRKERLTCNEYRKCHACHERVGIVFV